MLFVTHINDCTVLHKFIIPDELYTIWLLLYLWQAWQLIINQCSNMELQHLCVLRNDVSRCTVLLIALQLVVGLYDIGKLVCHVILCTITRHTIHVITTQWHDIQGVRIAIKRLQVQLLAIPLSGMDSGQVVVVKFHICSFAVTSNTSQNSLQC